LYANVDMPLQFVTAYECKRLRGLTMAERTIVDKAGEVGMEMASDVAGAIKTAIGAATTTVTGVAKIHCEEGR
jgi:hypothetical protein